MATIESLPLGEVWIEIEEEANVRNRSVVTSLRGSVD